MSHQLKRGLSGYIPVRNAKNLDYCLREAVESLLPVCDQVVIADGESDDGTKDTIFDLWVNEPKIRWVTYPWPNPVNQPDFFVRWIQFARQHLEYDMQLELDADEVLDPISHDKIREIVARKGSANFKRLNFWKNAQHLAPHNRCCGTMVARLAPSHLYMPSDEPNPAVEPNARTYAETIPGLQIFHYGFLRNPDAFVRKSREVQNMFFGSVDSRITEMADQGKRWDDREYFDIPLQAYRGTHPLVAHKWLRDRGYSPT